MPKKIINYKTRAEFIRQYEKLKYNNRTNFNAAQKRDITRKYNRLKKFTGIRHVKKTPSELKKLKSRGYQVSGKGVFIDDIRDGAGNKINGSSVTLLNNNITRITLGAIGSRIVKRVDYIYNFTAQEKIDFITDPENFIINLIKSTPVLNKNFDINILRNKPTRQHIRFQFGAYGTHAALSLDVLNYYMKEHNEKNNNGFFEMITGIRFIKYTQIKKKAKTKTKTKKRNKK